MIRTVITREGEIPIHKQTWRSMESVIETTLRSGYTTIVDITESDGRRVWQGYRYDENGQEWVTTHYEESTP